VSRGLLDWQLKLQQHSKSFAIADSAPSHNNGAELFTRASVPPATRSKDNPEWNLVSAATVGGEHIDNCAVLGEASGVPFRFGHPSPILRRL